MTRLTVSILGAAIACVVLAGLVGTCSVRPGGPSDGMVPSYDAAAALQADAVRDEKVKVLKAIRSFRAEDVEVASDGEICLPVVALTDRMTSPLVRFSDAILTVPEVDFGAFRSLSATIAMAIALAVAVGSARGS